MTYFPSKQGWVWVLLLGGALLIVGGARAVVSSQQIPTIRTSEATQLAVDFVLKEPGRARSSFVVKNDEDEDVQVRIMNSCSCGTIEPRNFTLAPGDSKSVVFSSKPLLYGEDSSFRVFIACADSSRVSELHVRVVCPAPVAVEPDFVDLGDVEPAKRVGFSIRARLHERFHDPGVLHRLRMIPSCAEMEVLRTRRVDVRTIEFTISMTPQLRSRPARLELLIPSAKDSDESLGSIIVPVTWNCVAPIEITPSSILVQPGGAYYFFVAMDVGKTAEVLAPRIVALPSGVKAELLKVRTAGSRRVFVFKIAIDGAFKSAKMASIRLDTLFGEREVTLRAMPR